MVLASAEGSDGIVLRSGYSANAEIVLAEANQVLAVPESAITFEGDSTFVYVATGANGQETQYERRPVTTGLSDGVNIEVKSGLTTADRVRGPQIIAEEK